jgi:hypothetical protein
MVYLHEQAGKEINENDKKSKLFAYSDMED